MGPTARAAVEAFTIERSAVRTESTLLGVGPERVRQWLREAELDTGIKSWPHLLRHCFGSDMAQRTDPATWRELMGHADLSQFARYAHTTRERKREAVANL